MPRFEIEIQGDGLERALATLNAAGIPTIGPAFSAWGSDPAEWRVSNEMWAVLDARSAEAAEARVRDNLPKDADYTVLPAKPFEPPADVA
jgi:hypothetical protein